MFTFVLRAALLAALGLSHAFSLAQPASIPAQVLPAGADKPRIDGRLDDAVWASAPVYSGFRRFRPDLALDPAPYRTELRVLIEPDALVFAVRAWDPEPTAIRAPLSRRDQVWPDQDSVTLWIDGAGRGQVAQFVRVNAAGSVSDGLYSAAVDEEDDAPDFLDVEVASQRLVDGYSVEIRWPLANLRYPLGSSAPWGFMVTRRVPRSSPMNFASAPLDREQAHLLTQLQSLQDEAPLRAQLGSGQHLQAKLEGTLRSSDPGKTKANVGLEVQWRPRADWVVDATFRPDFSQVELDDPQLAGNSRFALFVPEKRAFFLESSDVVGQVPPDQWGVSRGLLAFYSRAVTDPRWGVRATFRGNTQEATALILRDAGGGLALRPSAFGTESLSVDQPSNLLFARHRTQVTEQLALAAVLSLRDWGHGASTAVSGVDGLLNLSDSVQLRGHLLGSQDRTAPGSLAKGDAQEGHAAWLSSRYREGDWRWSLDLERISPRFVNDNGFVPQAGIDRVSAEMLRAFHPEDSFLSAWELLARVTETRALRDPAQGVLQAQSVSQLFQPGLWALGPAATEVFAYWNIEKMRTRAGGQVHQPRSVLFGLNSHPSARLSFISLEGTVGERVDQEADRVGTGFSGSAQVTWREPLPSWGMDLELEQRYSQGRVAQRGGPGLLDERSSQTKVLLHLSREQAIRLLWQQQRLERAAEPGLLADRHRSHVGTLTWLARAGSLRGWSVGASMARTGQEPIQREVFVKYQQGWRH